MPGQSRWSSCFVHVHTMLHDVAMCRPVLCTWCAQHLAPDMAARSIAPTALTRCFYGGDEGNRTPDIYLAKANRALSQGACSR